MRSKRKKLAEAARLLARGHLRLPGDEGEPNAVVDEALAVWGLVAEEAIELEKDFVLWPECIDTFNLWLAVQTQWLTAPAGNKTGLNYPGVEVCLNARRIRGKKRDEVFRHLQAMEQAALNEWLSKH